MSGLETAIALACRAHTGQTDKAGEPYILHVLRVMLAVRGEEERIVAVLHDVVEDTPITLADLAGFRPDIVDAVDALTHRKGERYETYVRRAARNLLARKVKLADVEDNYQRIDADRLGRETAERLWDKYDQALDILNAGDARP